MYVKTKRRSSEPPASERGHAAHVAGVEVRMSDYTDAELDALAPEEDKKSRKSQADRILELAQGIQFFHADIDQPFATFETGNHVETWGVRTKGFRQWLSHAFYRKNRKAPSSQAIQDALNVLAGRAIHDG